MSCWSIFSNLRRKVWHFVYDFVPGGVSRVREWELQEADFRHWSPAEHRRSERAEVLPGQDLQEAEVGSCYSIACLTDTVLYFLIHGVELLVQKFDVVWCTLLLGIITRHLGKVLYRFGEQHAVDSKLVVLLSASYRLFSSFFFATTLLVCFQVNLVCPR